MGRMPAWTNTDLFSLSFSAGTHFSLSPLLLPPAVPPCSLFKCEPRLRLVSPPVPISLPGDLCPPHLRPSATAAARVPLLWLREHAATSLVAAHCLHPGTGGVDAPGKEQPDVLQSRTWGLCGGQTSAHEMLLWSHTYQVEFGLQDLAGECCL